MSDKLFVYKVLCILRITLVLIPQAGYIHPDEHFQGPEIAYGDLAEYKVLRTWEFSSSEPVRSIIFPYSIITVPAIILHLLTWLHYNVTSYLLLVLPRLLICIYSFLQDICIYQICGIVGANSKACLMLFASSYVTLVYFTRTFSNSFESILFAFFLFLLFKSIKLHQNVNESKDGFLNQLIFYSFMSGIILVYGCFIRPTFICFTAFPMIVWCFMIYNMKTHTKIHVLISFALGAFSIGVSLIAIDSLYYNKLHYSLIKKFVIVCTPCNFIFYNLNTMNLSSHGLHARWLHALINIPLLFSIYGVLLVFHSIMNFFYIFRKLSMDFEMVLLLSFFTPLTLLSMIPHQEPRFIIPIIIPFCLLYNGPSLKKYLTKNIYVYIWISCNILCLLFYGFIHQAGVYLSISHLNNVIENNNAIIFYKTYMPPRYLLFPNEKSKNIGIYDFAGLNLDEFESRMHDIIVNNKPSKVFVVLPYKSLSLDITFEALTTSGFKFFQKTYLFPHLSTENLPDFSSVLPLLRSNGTLLSNLHDIQEIFSIHIIRFDKYIS